VNDLRATGEGIKWYAADNGGEPLAAITELEDGHQYFASQTVSGCESTLRFAVTAVVDGTPCAPTGDATQPFCLSSTHTLMELVAYGEDLKWYAADAGGNPLPGSTVLTATDYYATQTISCTESAKRLKVTVVNSCP
jgi:hypothetical protein